MPRCPRIALAPVIAVAIALVLALPAAGQPAIPVTVTIDPLAPGPAVSKRFLGLSFEAASLARIAQYADRGNLVTLLRSLGPGVLRFGGITADENVAWTDASTPPPSWASSTIDAADLRAIGMLARRTGWQVLLTIGLAHDEPAAAAREVAAAHAALGPYLAAVEIGNEPDAYGRHGYRALPWIAQGYEEEVSEYRESIARLTPDIPIAGPDVSGSGVFPEWGEEEALSQRPALLTGHHYPLGCAQTPPPSIDSLLSPATRGREAQSLETYLRISRTYNIPMRIDEANTVSCGGVPGISDTFASALWATAYITQTMAAGAAGINLEGNPTNCAGYTPLCAPNPADIASGDLRAQPEWYALLLTHSLADSRPLPTTFSVASSSGASNSLPPNAGSPTVSPDPGSPSPAANPGSPSPGSPSPEPPAAESPVPGSPGSPGSPNLVATSFSGPDHSIQVVLVNDEPPGATPLAPTLDLGLDMGAAHVLRLTAPAPGATASVALAGRGVAPNGSWRTPARTEALVTHGDTVSLTLPPSSAVLVTVSPPRPRPKPHGHRRTARR